MSRGVHDLGGRAAGPVTPDAHDYAAWEKRIDALAMVLQSPPQRLIRVDERRRHVESLGAEAYHAMGYYERWMHALCALLIERGILSVDEVGRRMAEIAARAPEAP